MTWRLDRVVSHFQVSANLISSIATDSEVLRTMVDIADRWIASLSAGGKVMFAGNGGSAADAQHIAGELVSRLIFDRPALAGLALTTDTSVLTAIGNDYGYEHVFERQIIGLGRPGDVFVAISTSGRSPNILRAMRAARENGVVTIGFTGRAGGSMVELSDLCLRIPSDSTPLIQQAHITAAHAICEIVEERLFGDKRPSRE